MIRLLKDALHETLATLYCDKGSADEVAEDVHSRVFHFVQDPPTTPAFQENLLPTTCNYLFLSVFQENSYQFEIPFEIPFGRLNCDTEK